MKVFRQSQKCSDPLASMKYEVYPKHANFPSSSCTQSQALPSKDCTGSNDNLMKALKGIVHKGNKRDAIPDRLEVSTLLNQETGQSPQKQSAAGDDNISMNIMSATPIKESAKKASNGSQDKSRCQTRLNCSQINTIRCLF